MVDNSWRAGVAASPNYEWLIHNSSIIYLKFTVASQLRIKWIELEGSELQTFKHHRNLLSIPLYLTNFEIVQSRWIDRLVGWLVIGSLEAGPIHFQFYIKLYTTTYNNSINTMKWSLGTMQTPGLPTKFAVAGSRPPLTAS